MECFGPAFRRRNVGAEGRFHLQKSAAESPFWAHPTEAYYNPQNQATVDFRGMTPMSNCACDEQRETIRLNCPEKRRQALRGRNSREGPVPNDGAGSPMRQRCIRPLEARAPRGRSHFYVGKGKNKGVRESVG